MKETAKALLSKNKNELSAARALYVSLDRADNVIEGTPSFRDFAKGWVFKFAMMNYWSRDLTFSSFGIGRGGGDRTHDLRLKTPLLYH